MSATDELLEKLRTLKYDYDSMSTSLEDAIDDIAYELEQAIAATLGKPERTCHIEERYIDWYCDACFEMVGTCDTTSELYVSGNMIEMWNYCPNCGAKVMEQ